MLRPPTCREVLQGWRILTLMAKCNSLNVELEEARLLSKPTSIWTMKKPDLVEVARKEIGLRSDQATKLTVIEIRELIRQHRESVKAMEDPLMKLPVGLARMTVEQLKEECVRRNIQHVSRVTRVQMIMAIKEQVGEARGSEAHGSDWQMADSA
jgi:hypothetical protein